MSDEPATDEPVTGDPWDGYYTTVSSREPRDTLVSALAAFDTDDAQNPSGATGRHAVDLACGDGTDTLALLARGWSVTAVDASPAFPAHLLPRVPADALDRLEIRVEDFRTAALPACDLVHAGFALFFCPPEDFGGLWQRVRGALRPGGRVACHLLGPKDTWATEAPGDGTRTTWQDRAAVDALLAGLVVERLEETDEDGWSYAGEKHWHLWRVLARRPS
ncbi:MAG: class I SAM-dependent methyltransferase [Actinobacteria bacterium]|nr:class I SAM-dependent methyltransferase [Actinomycetota bacterium]